MGTAGSQGGVALQGLERLHLIMGEQCNVRCTMCYQTDFSPKNNMPRAIYAEKLASVYAHLRMVKIQGGEPTIMRNCRELAEILMDHLQVGISMSTNGSRLEGFWREAVLGRPGQVEISLHAACAETYSKIVIYGDFQPVVDNIRALTFARRGPFPSVGITVVILKENARELHRIVTLARDLGVDWVKFTVDPILSFAGLPSDADMVEELSRVDSAQRSTGMKVMGLARFRQRFVRDVEVGPDDEEEPRGAGDTCLVPQRNLVVDAQGDVRACVRTWEIIGNLYLSSLEEIWNGEKAHEVRWDVESGAHKGCEPWCAENRNPSRLVLLSKYASYAQRNPAFFARKLQQKLVQLGKATLPVS
jgi:MoaA/NifB/PqqE/SkfB family radical SAM enzyme